MTDRYAGYIVTMEEDMRDDDAQSTIDAISHIRGVLKVEPVVSTPEVHFGRARAFADMKARLFQALNDY